MNQDLSMYRPAAFSIIYGLENTDWCGLNNKLLGRNIAMCMAETTNICEFSASRRNSTFF